MVKNHNRMQPAFPSVCDTETKSILNFGMTLRDYFAAKAMDGIIASTVGIGLEINEDHIEIIAKKAYMY